TTRWCSRRATASDVVGGCPSNHGGCGERSGGARRQPRCQMAARSSLLRRPTPGARPARRTSSVVAALAALAPRLVRLAHHGYSDRLLVTGRVTDVVPIYLALPPREIAYVKFVFESYEGVAVVRTLDRHAAHVVVLVAPDFETDARAVVRSLAGEGACAETGPPAGFDGDWLGPEEGD